MEIKPVKLVDRSNQLKIEKHGLIVTFKHKRSGDRYHIQMSHLRAMIFGNVPYMYANEWIPKPEGRPKGFSPKKKTITPLINNL